MSSVQPSSRRPVIRSYRDTDQTSLVSLASRLSVGIPQWRSVEGMQAAARQWVDVSIKNIGPEAAVFVADHDGVIAGFASVSREVAFTGEAQAYIGELAVAAEAEGQGIGQALLAAVERWAREHGLGLLVLDTGAGNSRGRHFYAQSGFLEESVRLTRILGGPGSCHQSEPSPCPVSHREDGSLER